MINKYEDRLGTERMLPLVFKMALPAVAAQFVNLLYSMVDRIYIGHIPGIGTDALAGVGVTTSLVILISSFSAIVGGGGAPLAAIALGQGDRSRAGKILGNGFILLILFTLFTSLIAYTFMEPILLFTGASENTLEYAVDYLSIYLLGTIFVEISTGLNSFINAQGRPAIAMYSVLIGALLNIVLDPIFIFWLDMGVKGAAYAAKEFFYMKTLKDYIISCKGRTRVRVTMSVKHKERDSMVTLSDIGDYWYQAKSKTECIMEEPTEAVFEIHNIMKHTTEEFRIDLTEFPKRPPKTTRISVDFKYLSENKFQITITDLGFGEFFKSSGMSVTKEIEIG